MATDASLGEFEQLVLLAVLRCGEDAYGMAVRRTLHERTGRDAAIGAVYATLDRLEGKGLLRSRETGGEASRGGRAKRWFHVTAAGLRSLKSAEARLARMREGLELA
jgi:DNA-binding PadR family transcriptional regulator